MEFVISKITLWNDCSSNWNQSAEILIFIRIIWEWSAGFTPRQVVYLIQWSHHVFSSVMATTYSKLYKCNTMRGWLQLKQVWYPADPDKCYVDNICPPGCKCVGFFEVLKTLSLRKIWINLMGVLCTYCSGGADRSTPLRSNACGPDKPIVSARRRGRSLA